MPQIKVDIVIPIYYNDGTPISDKKLTKTLDELTERFAGNSIENSTIEGRWVQRIGERKLYYKDKNRMLWVICDDTKENRVFFTKFKRKLMIRFRQKSIFMLITNDVSVI